MLVDVKGDTKFMRNATAYRVFLAFWMLGGALLGSFRGQAGEAAAPKQTAPAPTPAHPVSAKIAVQGVQASLYGKNTQKPSIAKTLARHARLLKNLGYGKYEDLGKAGGTASLSQPAQIKIGPYVIRFRVLRSGKKGTVVQYVVKTGGKKIFQGSTLLKPGRANPIQVGKLQHPVILLMMLGK